MFPRFKWFLIYIMTALLWSGCSDDCSLDDIGSSSDYLPLDDSEYPYAGIPRIVIETEKQAKIKNRETEIPAKMQLWGEHEPIGNVLGLTIRGRGNSSWDNAPKKGYKIKLNQKIELLGMHKDSEWALIANYSDKSMLKNLISYKLLSKISNSWNPEISFVELYLNKDYLGIYALTETVKKNKHRVDLADGDFLLEIDAKIKEGELGVEIDGFEYPFKIHWPKDANDEAIQSLKNRLADFQKNIYENRIGDGGEYKKWVDLEKFIFFYWAQEFSKNIDAYYTSTFLVVKKNGVIEMGPVWDMDFAFGYPGWNKKELLSFEGFQHRTKSWMLPFFKNKNYAQYSDSIWKVMSPIVSEYADSILSNGKLLEQAYRNEENRWKKLESTTSPLHHKSYSSYEDAYMDLHNWYVNRQQWLDQNIH